MGEPGLHYRPVAMHGMDHHSAPTKRHRPKSRHFLRGELKLASYFDSPAESHCGRLVAVGPCWVKTHCFIGMDIDAFGHLDEAICDQCQYGLRHPENGVPIKKH